MVIDKSREIDFEICDPAGNITAIVISKAQEHSRRKIVDYLMSQECLVEQVGFLILDDKNKSVPRIEMMGGEFSGNGLASAGLVLARLEHKVSFLVNSSGLAKPARILLTADNGMLGNKKDGYDIVNINFTITARRIERTGHGRGVELEGITHYFHFCKAISEASIEKAKETISYDRTGNKAVGVIFVKQDVGFFEIVPFVFVRGVKTFVKETACSSGSLALSLFWMMRKGIGPPLCVSVRQPSGQTIRTTVNAINGENINVSLDIPVRYLRAASMVIS